MTSKKRNSTSHYVNNERMYNELRLYKERLEYARLHNKPLPRVPEYIGECFMLIAKKLATKPCFAYYSYKEEMELDAIENCIMAVNNFNCDKGTNPFAYFTQITWFAFLRRIEAEKKQTAIKHKNYLVNLSTELAHEFGKMTTLADLEISQRVMDEFDKKRLTKKTKSVTVDEVVSEEEDLPISEDEVNDEEFEESALGATTSSRHK